MKLLNGMTIRLQKLEKDMEKLKGSCAKYEFTGDTMEHEGVTLKRIRRIKDGLVGGWIESESNLSQEGDCFVSSNAKVYGKAKVYGDAHVDNNARVYDDAQVCDDAITGNASIGGSRMVGGEEQLPSDKQKKEYELEVWANIYIDDSGVPNPVIYFSKYDADSCAGPDRVACVKLKQTIKEGEGL